MKFLKKIEGGSGIPTRLVQFSFRISKTRIDAEEMNKFMFLTDIEIELHVTKSKRAKITSLF